MITLLLVFNHKSSFIMNFAPEMKSQLYIYDREFLEIDKSYSLIKLNAYR